MHIRSFLLADIPNPVIQHLSIMSYDLFDVCQEILESFSSFLSNNKPPQQHKILVSMLVVACFGITIFARSALIHSLRKVNILKVKRYSLLICFQWTLGAVLLDFILVVAQISNYNIITFLVTAMIWDNLYRKIFNQAKEKEIANLDTLEEK